MPGPSPDVSSSMPNSGLNGNFLLIQRGAIIHNSKVLLPAQSRPDFAGAGIGADTAKQGNSRPEAVTDSPERVQQG